MTAKEFILGFKERVNPEALADKGNTNFQFKISGDGGGDFTAIIEDGQLDVKEGLHGEAKCIVSASDQTLMDIVTGKKKAMPAVFMGKLKISNVSELTKFAKPLGLM